MRARDSRNVVVADVDTADGFAQTIELVFDEFRRRRCSRSIKRGIAAKRARAKSWRGAPAVTKAEQGNRDG